MIANLWFPVLLVLVGVVWLILAVLSLGKPRPPRRAPRRDNGDSVIPFMWGGDDGDDSHHGLH